VKWLCKKVIRSAIQTCDEVGDAVSGGDDYDWRDAFALAVGAYDVEPVTIGQTEVDDQELIDFISYKFFEYASRRGQVDDVSVGLEFLHKQFGKSGVIFQKQNTHTDIISCIAIHMIQHGYFDRELISKQGSLF